MRAPSLARWRETGEAPAPLEKKPPRKVTPKPSVSERDLAEARKRNHARLSAVVDPQTTERRRIRKEHGWCAYRCEICDRKIQGKALNLDHCHVTGKVRGWLCTPCNTGLGMFRDSVHLLSHAVDYLKKHGSWSSGEP
jgi:hypothetical protein